MRTSFSRMVFGFLLGFSVLTIGRSAWAAPPDIRITSVAINSDYKTMTIAVSRADQSLFIDYQILVNGQSQGGGGGSEMVSDMGIIVMQGPRDWFESLNGEGTYTLVLRACPQDQSTGSNYAKYCGEPYSLTVQYRDPSVLEQVANVSFSPDFDTATVTLSRAISTGILRYEIRADGILRSSGQATASNTTVVMINGLRERFIAAGGAQYRVAFRLCENRDSLQNQKEQCSAETIIPVSFRVDGGFADVNSSHPHEEAIAYLRERGIVSGYPDGTFRPDQQINRVEFLKIITLHKWGSKVGECGGRVWFKDFERDAWYLNFVCMAQMYHLVDGYPDGTFRPQNSINFAEAAKIITRADDRWQQEAYPGTGVWYERYVRYLQDMSAIPVSIASFDQMITRGEMAEIMYRLEADRRSKPSKTYEEIGST